MLNDRNCITGDAPNPVFRWENCWPWRDFRQLYILLGTNTTKEGRKEGDIDKDDIDRTILSIDSFLPLTHTAMHPYSTHTNNWMSHQLAFPASVKGMDTKFPCLIF